MPSEGNEGEAVAESVRKAASEVGGTRAGGGNADAGAAGDAGVALSGKDLSLLVAAKDVANGGGLREHLMDLHGGAARVCKEDVEPRSLKRLHKNVCSFPGLISAERRRDVLIGSGGGGGEGGVGGVDEGVGDEESTWKRGFGDFGERKGF